MTDGPYYTRRTRPAPIKDQLEIGRNFWLAWRHYLKELGGKNYLCEHMGDECSDGHPFGWSMDAIQMKLRRELGDIEWPSDDDAMPTDQGVIFDFIELFARFVSKPTDSWFHSWCRNSHPREYDAATGRAEYEVD